jgi:iron complex outermembrane recepter protein
MSSIFNKAPLLTAIALALSSQLSSAQVLEEIIVTAQKRVQNLQDVPISVTAIQGSKIKDAGIANMAALSDYVPNLIISDAPVSENIYMRGMGSSNNQAFEQSVGMYIDGVYMGRGRQYRAPFMDIERVEVLRGPQGALFGKNTVAGAVSVITASPGPGDELTGSIAQSVESNDGYITEGMLSGSVTDNFALRGAFKYRETDGFVDNTFLDQDEPNIEETVYRLSAAWDITENLFAKIKYGHSKLERVGVASGTTVYLSPEQREEQVPNRSLFATIAYDLTDLNYPQFSSLAGKEYEIFKDNGYGPDKQGVAIGINPESSDTETDNYMLNLDYALGEHTVTAITGWSEYDTVDGADVDYLPLQFIARDDDQTFEQFSQEIRIASPTGGFFEYIAGAYYEESELEFDRLVVIDLALGGLVQPTYGVSSLLTLLTGGAYGADQIARSHHYKVDSDSWAVFFQGTFHLSDNWRLTPGLRYTEESKDASSTQFLSDSIMGIGVPNDNFYLGQTMAESFNTYSYRYNRDRDTDQWIPSINVQWDVTDDSMLYATYSEGFKSGGFSGADDGNPAGVGVGEWQCESTDPAGSCFNYTVPAEDFEFDDETVKAWEIGGKHTLLRGAMTANWAAFYTEYTDLQTSIFKGIGFGVTNAAEVTVQGLEVDLLWQATERLRVGANGAYLDASYDAFPGAPCTAIQLDVDPLCGNAGGSVNDVDGENTTFAPEYTAAVYFDYGYMLGSGMTLFLSGEGNYSDEFDTQGDLDEVDTTDSYGKINLRLGLRGAQGDWEVMLYGRNITDEEVYAYGYDIPSLAGSHGAMISEGQVFGIRAKYQF